MKKVIVSLIVGSLSVGNCAAGMTGGTIVQCNRGSSAPSFGSIAKSDSFSRNKTHDRMYSNASDISVDSNETLNGGSDDMDFSTNNDIIEPVVSKVETSNADYFVDASDNTITHETHGTKVFSANNKVDSTNAQNKVTPGAEVSNAGAKKSITKIKKALTISAFVGGGLTLAAIYSYMFGISKVDMAKNTGKGLLYGTYYGGKALWWGIKKIPQVISGICCGISGVFEVAKGIWLGIKTSFWAATLPLRILRNTISLTWDLSCRNLDKMHGALDKIRTTRYWICGWFSDYYSELYHLDQAYHFYKAAHR